ncbi:MAG: hypothetical protein AAB459_01720 [Patescibacteria group bacterium]
MNKSFFHDRIVLLLLSINAFLLVALTVFVVLRISGDASNYIVEFRANRVLSNFRTGNVWSIVSFIIFGFFVAVFNTILAKKSYHIKRHFSISILAMTSLLLGASLIVSNALLILR